MSCRYPNSITKTVANKLATSLSTAKLRGNGSNGFWALPIVVGDEQFSDMNSGSCLIVVSWCFIPQVSKRFPCGSLHLCITFSHKLTPYENFYYKGSSVINFVAVSVARVTVLMVILLTIACSQIRNLRIMKRTKFKNRISILTISILTVL